MTNPIPILNIGANHNSAAHVTLYQSPAER
jgi:hypothetical protein